MTSRELVTQIRYFFFIIWFVTFFRRSVDSSILFGRVFSNNGGQSLIRTEVMLCSIWRGLFFFYRRLSKLEHDMKQLEAALQIILTHASPISHRAFQDPIKPIPSLPPMEHLPGCLLK